MHPRSKGLCRLHRLHLQSVQPPSLRPREMFLEIRISSLGIPPTLDSCKLTFCPFTDPASYPPVIGFSCLQWNPVIDAVTVSRIEIHHCTLKLRVRRHLNGKLPFRLTFPGKNGETVEIPSAFRWPLTFKSKIISLSFPIRKSRFTVPLI